MRWSKAKEYCQDLGGKLVEIDSPQENEAIVDEIKKHSWSKEKKQFWMGLTDRRHEGFFVVESTGKHTTHISKTKKDYRLKVPSGLCREGAKVHQLGLEGTGQQRPLGTPGGLCLYQDKHEVERLGL